MNTTYLATFQDQKDKYGNLVKGEIAGRYESRNILIQLEGDSSGKEYLFSTSSWYSYTELYDLESDNYWTWFTTDFFDIPDNKYIFSYKYNLLKQPNQNIYFLVYIQYKTTTFAGTESKSSSSEYFAIKKFSLKSVNGKIQKDIKKTITNSDNFDNRVISSIILASKNVIIVYFVKTGSKLTAKSYDYDLNAKEEVEVSSITVDPGQGTFFEGFHLDGSLTAILYYNNKDDPNHLYIKLYEYDSTFTQKIYKEIYKNGITLKTYVLNNEVSKLSNTRIIFTCYNDDSNRLYIYLFDFYSSYTKIVVTMYYFSVSNYKIQKEMASYMFNDYTLFTAMVDDGGIYSILMYFGYPNGEDSFIDISPYFLDSNNTDTSLNLFDYLKSKLVVENNVFDFSAENKIKLVSIPDEILMYTDTTKLNNEAIITENPKLYQNQALLKTNKNYSLYYQLYVKEPDFDHFLANAQQYLIFDNNGGEISADDAMKTEYSNRIGNHLPGKTIKVDFELCFKYCETCKALGITEDNQYCVTCKEDYRFDYWNYFGKYPSNCVPENKFNDLQTGKLETCTKDNSKFYFNTTDGKRYCFKYEYDCPPPYPYLNLTTHECLNITIPTTIPAIITTLPIIPTTIPKVVTTLVTTVPKPTIPRIRCTYNLLIEDKCDFTNDTNTEIYGELRNDVVETFPVGGEPAGVQISGNLYFGMSLVSTESSILDGTKPNIKNISVIDLGDCAKKLIAAYGLPADTDLIILRLESLGMDKNGKSVQYEVYAPGSNQKLDLSKCSDTKIKIVYPVTLDEETQKLYDELKSQGYDLFDKNNKFYTDICTPYKSAEGADIILADRNNDFFAKHEIVCQANCEFYGYNAATSYVSCICDAADKERIEAEQPQKATEKKIDSFVDILKFSNYKVLYCYNLVFRAVTFYKNFGSILSLLYFIGYLISFGFFWYKGFLTPLKKEIAKLFKKKHDIRNISSNLNNFKNNNINKKDKNLNININNKKVNIVTDTKLKEVMNNNKIKETEKIIIKVLIKMLVFLV